MPASKFVLQYHEPPPGFEWRLPVGTAVTFVEEEFRRGSRRLRAQPADFVDPTLADHKRRPYRSRSVNYNDEREAMWLTCPEFPGKVWVVIDRWFDPAIHNEWYRLLGADPNETGWVRDYPMLGMVTLVEAELRRRQEQRDRRGDHG